MLVKFLGGVDLQVINQFIERGISNARVTRKNRLDFWVICFLIYIQEYYFFVV